MDSCEEFFFKVVRVYKWFGVAPMKKTIDLPKKNVAQRNLLITWLPPLCFVFLYWLTMVLAVTTRKSGADLISIVSNYIQLLFNGCALSMVIIMAVYNRGYYKKILNGFYLIDQQFKSFGCAVDYKKQLKVFYSTICIFFIVLIGQYSYEYYVLLIRKEIFPIPYWIIHAIPFLVYGLCLQQAAYLIYCVLLRCRMVNDLLRRKRLAAKPLRGISANTVTVDVPVNRDETFKTIHQLTDGIHELCESVNGYFGMSFLASLMAMFAVTSIQAFYCYKIGRGYDEATNRTIWTLFVSIIAVVDNIVLVAVLSVFANMVTTEAIGIKTNVRKLEDKEAIQYSSWLHPLLINIKINAFGFFNVNLGMLCGFLSALITYLLIMIQCNEISGNSLNQVEQMSAGGGPKQMITK